MTNGLHKTMQVLKTKMLFKDGEVEIAEKKVYVLKIKDIRGARMDIDIPADNDKEAEIFIQGILSANWLVEQMHTR
jgi:hypothetical protein